MSASTLTTERPPPDARRQEAAVQRRGGAARAPRKAIRRRRRPGRPLPRHPRRPGQARVRPHLRLPPGPDDVHVSLAQVKAKSLRPGDAVVGTARPAQVQPRQVRHARDRRVRERLSPPRRRHRPEFGELTPLSPQERLRLDTGPLATRVIDLIAPSARASAASSCRRPRSARRWSCRPSPTRSRENNPEVHLMVVLVDERPEEVTDMQRSVRGEVIHSTFDRPARDHTALAELAIERAKRLVEQGHDVVVLLDSITRLGRAYNLAAPSSSRILAGGVATTAIYPPKKFFGAARNIENGGSLTILATALVETGSRMDDVFFEEFKGTGNMELQARPRASPTAASSRPSTSTRPAPAATSCSCRPRSCSLLAPAPRPPGPRQAAGPGAAPGEDEGTSSNAEFLLPAQADDLTRPLSPSPAGTSSGWRRRGAGPASTGGRARRSRTRTPRRGCTARAGRRPRTRPWARPAR